MRPDKLAFDIATKTDVIYEKIKEAQVTTLSNTSSLEHQFLNFHVWSLNSAKETFKVNLYFYETSVPNLIGIKGLRTEMREKVHLNR